MAKGYWIGRVDVRSDEGYKPYAMGNQAIFNKYGARYVVRAGKFECVEGNARSRNVVIEFPDYATALACYNSAEYQANMGQSLAARDRFAQTGCRGGDEILAHRRCSVGEIAQKAPANAGTAIGG